MADESIKRTNITNYIPHHCVTSHSKPSEKNAIFNAGAKYQKTCFIDHLLKGPDLLNNLVLILMRFPVVWVCSVR